MPRSSWIFLGSALGVTVTATVAVLVSPAIGVKLTIVAFPLAAFLAVIERGLRP